MKSFASVVTLSTLFFSSVLAQGCDLESGNAYCLRPFYTNVQTNATFDDLKLNTAVTDYMEAEWSGLTVKTMSNATNLAPSSIKNYAVAEDGEVVMTATTDYFYLIDFHFGCATDALSAKAEACTLKVEGVCLPLNFPEYVGGQLETLEWTYSYKAHKVNGTASLKSASPFKGKTTFAGTSETKQVVLCTNYTLTATTPSGGKTSLFLDDVHMSQYTTNDDY